MMPWVIGAVVAYVGWRFYEASKNPSNNFWNEEQLISQANQGKESGPTTYTYPANMVL